MVFVPLICWAGLIAADAALQVNNGSSIDGRKDQTEYIYGLIENDLFLGLGNSATAKITQLTNNAGRAAGFESILYTYPVNNGILGTIGCVILYIATYILMRSPKKPTYRYVFNAILLGHLVFAVLTGEMQTTRMFWLLFSMFYALHLNTMNTRKFEIILE